MTTGIQWTDETKTKWCTACKSGHARAAFGKDPTRSDGLATRCLASRRVTNRKQPGYRKGTFRHGWLAPARDGDQKQARRRINYLVEQHRIPHPNAVPCTDCAHIWEPGERRHEYDHHLGYSPEHQLDVESVCSSCHHTRERARNGRH